MTHKKNNIICKIIGLSLIGEGIQKEEEKTAQLVKLNRSARNKSKKKYYYM